MAVFNVPTYNNRGGIQGINLNKAPAAFFTMLSLLVMLDTSSCFVPNLAPKITHTPKSHHCAFARNTILKQRTAMIPQPQSSHAAVCRTRMCTSPTRTQIPDNSEIEITNPPLEETASRENLVVSRDQDKKWSSALLLIFFAAVLGAGFAGEASAHTAVIAQVSIACVCMCGCGFM
jgi:hypothetical protein